MSPRWAWPSPTVRPCRRPTATAPSSASTAAGTATPSTATRWSSSPSRTARPSGMAQDVVTGFLDGEQARGRPVGLAIDGTGALLIADDAGNTVWRVAAADGSVTPQPIPTDATASSPRRRRRPRRMRRQHRLRPHRTLLRLRLRRARGPAPQRPHRRHRHRRTRTGCSRRAGDGQRAVARAHGRRAAPRRPPVRRRPASKNGRALPVPSSALARRKPPQGPETLLFPGTSCGEQAAADFAAGRCCMRHGRPAPNTCSPPGFPAIDAPPVRALCPRP